MSAVPASGFAYLHFDVTGRARQRRHRTAALGLEPCRLGPRAGELAGHRARRVGVPAGVAVVPGFWSRRTFTIGNMPPMPTAPKGPVPAIIAAVLSGKGISISVMSSMPRSPITLESGISGVIWRATWRCSTLIIVGMPCPIALIVCWPLWQWQAQSPSSLARKSICRNRLTAMSAVSSYWRVLIGVGPPSVPVIRNPWPCRWIG
jgi:hypothetical protein